LYGGLFDILAVVFQRLLPFVEPYSIRHILCALIGIAGIGAIGATARLVAGPRAGAIAAFALAVCGPWYGSMFNRTKDIPFAAAMMGATYFLLRASRNLPYPLRRHVVPFGILLGCALGMRVLGLLLVAMPGLSCACTCSDCSSSRSAGGLAFFHSRSSRSRRHSSSAT
jgi:dolichyl-phosphate-mannose--protein O-mannosyl transferase